MHIMCTSNVFSSNIRDRMENMMGMFLLVFSSFFSLPPSAQSLASAYEDHGRLILRLLIVFFLAWNWSTIPSHALGCSPCLEYYEHLSFGCDRIYIEPVLKFVSS